MIAGIKIGFEFIRILITILYVIFLTFQDGNLSILLLYFLQFFCISNIFKIIFPFVPSHTHYFKLETKEFYLMWLYWLKGAEPGPDSLIGYSITVQYPFKVTVTFDPKIAPVGHNLNRTVVLFSNIINTSTWSIIGKML